MAIERLIISLCLTLCLSLPSRAAAIADSLGNGCPVVEMPVQRLPDLNIARAGHATVAAGGEIVVFGGHTHGFVPTPTAERYSNGVWHVMPMVYTHDQALMVPLHTGRILLAGGHKQSLGIGQTFTLELYDPATHTFEGFGCLDTKRAFADGTALGGGKIVISGNWYERDATEMFNGKRQCVALAATAQQRSQPCVLQTAPDDAVIFGAVDTRGDPLDSVIVDRLQGGSLRPPLLQTWRPRHVHTQRRSSNSFIGNEASGVYDYLITVENAQGEMALMRVTGGTDGEPSFALLRLSAPIPRVFRGDSITYPSEVIADRSTQRAYLVGIDATRRFYIVEVGYAPALDGRTAPMTLHVSRPVPEAGYSQPTLTPSGDIIIAGGATAEGNFTPYSTALLFPVATATVASAAAQGSSRLVVAVGIAAVVALVALAVLLTVRRRKTISQRVPSAPGEMPAADASDVPAAITGLIRSKRLFCRSTLKTADIADELGIPARVIAEAVRKETGLTMPQFINTCRIEYAKQLLLQHPGIKLYVLATDVGFANESTFYRTFKSQTGMTPLGWLAIKGEPS